MEEIVRIGGHERMRDSVEQARGERRFDLIAARSQTSDDLDARTVERAHGAPTSFPHPHIGHNRHSSPLVCS